MKYNLVSADSHVDLSWLPGDLFVKNCAPNLRERMPHITQVNGEDTWMAGTTVLGKPMGTGFSFAPALKGRYRRIDRMFEAGYYEPRSDKKQRPTSPDLRIEDMAKDGVDAEVIYGVTGTGNWIKDPDVILETYRIYNDWIADFCRKSPGRWYALASIPANDPESAANELYRAAGLGLRGTDFQAAASIRPVYVRDGFWDPLWRAASETKMPISFHVSAGFKIRQLDEGKEDQKDRAYLSSAPTQNDLAYRSTFGPLSQLAGAEFLASIIISGACEKFPDFQFVLGECGAGWIPFVLNRLDMRHIEVYLDKRLEPPFSMKPSQYWRRQGATTFQNDACVGDMAELIGVNSLMWGSDYPHVDGVWPDSRAVIAETMGRLSKDVIRKITCDNAVKRYRMTGAV